MRAFNDPFEYTGSLTMVYDGNYRISGGQISVTNRKGKVVTRSLTQSGYFGGEHLLHRGRGRQDSTSV